MKLSVLNLKPIELSNQIFTDFEIVTSLADAKGEYIAFNIFENSETRFEEQITFLDNNKEFVGCGTFIKRKDDNFFYTAEASIIESELLKGHLPLEFGSFMFRNVGIIEPDFFKLCCSLLKYGKLTNLSKSLIKCDNYVAYQPNDLTEKKNFAKEKYKEIINIIHLNITSDGNFSGVDRYIKTLRENYPPEIRHEQITFLASKKTEWIIGKDQSFIRYNPNVTPLEHMYDQFWDNFKHLFLHKHNLIIQSNCLNLYSLITYLRRKVKAVHICAMHCVPYREAIRIDRKKYEELNKLFLDESKDFIESAETYQALELADHVILNTVDAAKYYERVGFLSQYSIINNGVEKIEKKEKTDDIFRFIFVGHSSPLKGMDQLLDIIEEVKNTGRQFEVLWAGSADKKLLEIIKQKDLPVKSYGVLHPDKLIELYAYVDCSLIATACETCSYAALEALSAGLPIIATKAPGVTEIVNSAIYVDYTGEEEIEFNGGILIEINNSGIIDKTAYVQAMCDVIDSAELRETMSKGSSSGFNYYDIKRIIPKMVRLYRSLTYVRQVC